MSIMTMIMMIMMTTENVLITEILMWKCCSDILRSHREGENDTVFLKAGTEYTASSALVGSKRLTMQLKCVLQTVRCLQFCDQKCRHPELFAMWLRWVKSHQKIGHGKWPWIVSITYMWLYL